ncbi:hypothetical protein ACFLYO_06340 [Chloroflexota bacterium]
MEQQPRSHQAITYRIKVKGKLRKRWIDWFGGMAITYELQSDGTPVTALTGKIIDQAALHGILTKIRDLNLELISVTRPEG